MAELRQRDVTATVVSAMVGGGIFLTPGILLRQGASPAQILLLFAIGGVVALAGAFTLAELASRRPGNGGPFRYISAGIGPRAGFLFNWSRFWVMQTGALAFLSLACAKFVAQGLGVDNPFWEAVAALALLAGTAGLNARGLKLGANVQLGITVLKIGALLALAIGVLLASPATSFTRPAPASDPRGLGSWMLITIFAYGGWTQVTFLAGEQKDPRKLAKPLAIGVLSAATIYLVALSAMFIALPDGTGGDVIASETAEALWGATGGTIVSFIIAMAILGGLHTMTLTGPRLYAAAAEAGRWWRPFAKRNRFDAPGRALWLQAEWSGLLIAFSLVAGQAITTLVGSISTAIWMFHILTAIAWFRLRREGQTDFSTPGGAITAGLFLAATVFVVGLSFWQDFGNIKAGNWGSLTSVWAGLVVLSGVPLALAFKVHTEPAARNST